MKVLNYLAEHPEIGILGGVKVFLLSTIDFEAIDTIGRIFQNIGYVFGGLLAALTFSAWVAKNILSPLFKWKK
jgi:hypothetical protein